jgi:poly-gamma-glutamate synthesis protein (capsule biosynthesis protein)
MSRTALRLAITGDLMLGRGVDDVVRAHTLAYPWGDLRPELRTADLTLGNLECCIAERGTPWAPGTKPFHFRAGPWAAPALADAGFDFVSLANNHTLDYGAEALEETLSYLSHHGIAHSGAGRDLAEASQPAHFETRGWRIAVFAAADHPADFAATTTSPGTRLLRPTATDPAGAELIRDVARARRSGYDLVVVSLHWGPNMNRRALPGFAEYARALIDAGAGVVHGHSAHLFQGVERYRGRPILYDTGDFVDDYAIDPTERNDLQFLFQLDFDPAGSVSVGLVPVRIAECRVGHALPAERAWLYDRMRRLSEELGSSWTERGGRLELA